MEKQQALGWGESVVETVAADLHQAFPATTGFSPRNLRDMKRLYLAYADETIWRQVVAKLLRGAKASDAEIWPQAAAKLTNETVRELLRQLVAEVPWGQNLLILNKLSDPAAHLYYIRAIGGHRIEDHFADVSKMIETKQRKRLGKSETPAKKKSE